MSYRQRWFEQVSWTRMPALVRSVLLTIGGMADDDGQGARVGMDRMHRILAVPRITTRDALERAVETGLVEKDATYAGVETRWRLVLSDRDQTGADHGAASD